MEPVQTTNCMTEVGSDSDGGCLADQIRLPPINVAKWKPNWPPIPSNIV